MSGCARRAVYVPEAPEPETALAEWDAQQIDLRDDLDTASLLLAIERSLTYYDSAGRDQNFHVAGHPVDARRMKADAYGVSRDCSIGYELGGKAKAHR